MKRLKTLALLACGSMILAGTGFAGETKLKGSVKIDGSSTTYLITEKMAAHFKKLHPDVNFTIGISGTGGGFKKFAKGETDISDASRTIKPAEAELCKKNGIDFLELQVAWDGLAVIINKENTWAAKMTVEQLKKIWHPNTADFKNAKKWSDVDPSWPDEELKLYGAGPDSGTFDYFTEAINGKEKVIRNDYTGSEDDNVIVQGVERSKYGMGFLGMAYYEGHKDKLAVVAVQNPKTKEFHTPTVKTVLGKQYAPLARPLFIYTRTDSMKRPEIKEFVQFYMRRADLVGESKYVPMSALQQLKERKKLDEFLKTAAN